ncbi:hypothetical protein F4776DRAFT_662290 [Hypoxylon sp. NC0597]|nr:hypothetical protein F4776DRAFT_662290 [Hypoxylon sp. NC0597]
MFHLISIMDTDEFQHNGQTNSSKQQQTLSVCLAEDEDSSNTPALQLNTTVTTAQKKIDDNLIRQSSLDSDASCTRSYKDKKSVGTAIGLQDQVLVASPSTKATHEIEGMKIIKSLRPTIKTILSRASQATSPGPGSSSQRQKPTPIPEVSPETTTLTGDNGKYQTHRRQKNNTTRTPSTADTNETKTRLRRYGKYLTVSEPYEDLERPRCPKCKWTLLSKPFSTPDVPVVMVTDPKGIVMYPYDHTYYPTDQDEYDSDDSDVWD